MINQLKVGIVGAGLMGYWHARYAQKSGAIIAAVVDPAESNLRAFQSRFPTVRAFSTLEQSLKDNPLDIIHICTPPASHFDLALAGLSLNLSVLCEKPLCARVYEAKQLIQTAKKMQVRLAPVHQFTNQSGFNSLLSKRHLLGQIVYVSHVICSHGGDGKTATQRRKLLQEILPHSAYMLFRLLGTSKPIDALRLVRCTEDALSLNCVFNDTLVNIEINLAGRSARNEFVVIGTDGSASVDLFHGFASLEKYDSGKIAKVFRPFANSVSTFSNAFVNLVHRATRGEAAFPGLLNTIEGFYASVHSRSSFIEEEEILCTTRLYERISGESNLCD